ncbi:hypothetical protein K1X22_03605 [Mycolicibacterium farcinogenes]|uniref:hypothetical protein n=1 Tax=Mycolicibacterium farcinogenes TaxID=1802 RepID=UPI001C8E01B0|nr:hypothetical protein [Mycolicibacterium farcinogenes]QZH60894.1 hypothetical protein K1X22_03605 [Mycolicibacterium farcinogenes]
MTDQTRTDDHGDASMSAEGTEQTPATMRRVAVASLVGVIRRSGIWSVSGRSLHDRHDLHVRVG